MSIFMCIVLTGLSFGLGQPHHARSTPAAASGANVRTLFRIPGLPRALITSCTILAAVDITLVYLPALGAEQGMTARLVGRSPRCLVDGLQAVLGPLSAKVGRRRLLVVSTIAAALRTAVVPIPMPIGLLVVVVSVIGLVAAGLGSAGVLWCSAGALAGVSYSDRRITPELVRHPAPAHRG